MKTLNSMKYAGVALALGAFLTFATPAQARFDYTDWQPQLGPTHEVENDLECQLNADYRKGLIDENELAMQRRDLDGITVKEDELRMDHQGLRGKDQRMIEARLNRFQQNLDQATADKAVEEPITFVVFE